MRISLDFGDGNGPLDYSAALVAAAPLGNSNIQKNVEGIVIERQRGTYARCRGTINAASAGLQPPQRGCRVVVRTAAGATLFSGTIVAPPQRTTALVDADAPVSFEAMEDAFLANTAPDTGLQPAGAATHAINFSDNGIVLEQATAVTAAERADDVLVTGAEEPVTYVTELFQGDGTTSTFALTAKPFVPSGSAALLTDSFTGTQFRSAVWRFVDTGQHITLGSGGLRLTGGNGFDGQTYMAAQEPVELGGTVCAEMHGVVLQPGSAGVLLGMYGNVVTAPTCFAGLQINAAAGAQSILALVNGAPAGTAFNWTAGHSYTFRVRLHCAETQRVLTSYQAVANGTVQTWGGGLVNAPVQIVIEVLDEGLASSTPATVLYAGAVSSSVASAVFAPVNSVSLLLSAAEISLKQQGSAWVTTTQTDGSVTVRRPGTLDTGEDYRISGTSLEFFSGRVPAPGALVTVTYRLSQRAQARVQSAAAIAQAAQLGLPGLRLASCRVTDPQPRSAADCAAAAQALLGFYASPAHGLRGTCSMPNAVATADVQPGDAIALPVASTPVNVPVKKRDDPLRRYRAGDAAVHSRVCARERQRAELSHRSGRGSRRSAARRSIRREHHRRAVWACRNSGGHSNAAGGRGHCAAGGRWFRSAEAR